MFLVPEDATEQEKSLYRDLETTHLKLEAIRKVQFQTELSAWEKEYGYVRVFPDPLPSQQCYHAFAFFLAYTCGLAITFQKQGHCGVRFGLLVGEDPQNPDHYRWFRGDFESVHKGGMSKLHEVMRISLRSLPQTYEETQEEVRQLKAMLDVVEKLPADVKSKPPRGTKRG